MKVQRQRGRADLGFEWVTPWADDEMSARPSFGNYKAPWQTAWNER